MDYNSKLIVTPSQYQARADVRATVEYSRKHPHLIAALNSVVLPVYTGWHFGQLGMRRVCQYLFSYGDRVAGVQPPEAGRISRSLSDRNPLQRTDKHPDLTDYLSRLAGLTLSGTVLLCFYSHPYLAILSILTMTGVQSLDRCINGDYPLIPRIIRRLNLLSGSTPPPVNFNSFEQVMAFMITHGGNDVISTGFPHNLSPYLAEQDQRELLQYLSQLVGTDEFRDAGNSKSAVVLRIIELLTHALSHPQHREPTLMRIHDSIIGCNDHALLTLSELEASFTLDQIEQHIAVQDIDEERLRQIAAQMFFFEEVRNYAIDFHRQQPLPPEGGSIEVENAFHILLRSSPRHSLPTSIRRMGDVTKKSMPLITQQHVEELKTCLDHKYTIQFQPFLERWGPWIKYQRSLSVSPYETMMAVPVDDEEPPVCIISLALADSPVLLNGYFYDYVNLQKWFISEGTDPITLRKVAWHQVRRAVIHDNST